MANLSDIFPIGNEEATSTTPGLVKVAQDIYDNAVVISDNRAIDTTEFSVDSYTIQNTGKYLVQASMTANNGQASSSSTSWVTLRLYVNGVQKTDAANQILNVTTGTEYSCMAASRVLDLNAGELVDLRTDAAVNGVCRIYSWTFTITPVALGQGN